MARLVLCHLVYSVVDSVEVELLSHLGDVELSCTCTFFSFHASLHICLSVPDHVAEELSELGSVLCLLKGVALEGFSHFGITLAVSLAAHGEVHTHLSTLTSEVILETLKHKCSFFSFWNSLCAAELVLASELESFSLFLELELLSWYFTLRAFLWWILTFIYIATYWAYPFLCHKKLDF